MYKRQVFDNILSRKITAKEIAGFDNIISGVDWGYYPDPWVLDVYKRQTSATGGGAADAIRRQAYPGHPGRRA